MIQKGHWFSPMKFPRLLQNFQTTNKDFHPHLSTYNNFFHDNFVHDVAYRDIFYKTLTIGYALDVRESKEIANTRNMIWKISDRNARNLAKKIDSQTFPGLWPPCDKGPSIYYVRKKRPILAPSPSYCTPYISIPPPPMRTYAWVSPPPPPIIHFLIVAPCVFNVS